MLRTNRLLATLALAWAPFAHAFETFTVRDIRVEGLQRTEPGTIFGYLPVKVGETMTEDRAAQAIRALYATGFFTDVRLEVEVGVFHPRAPDALVHRDGAQAGVRGSHRAHGPTVCWAAAPPGGAVGERADERAG